MFKGLNAEADKSPSIRKQVDFNQFEQHSYTDEELEHLLRI